MNARSKRYAIAAVCIPLLLAGCQSGASRETAATKSPGAVVSSPSVSASPTATPSVAATPQATGSLPPSSSQKPSAAEPAQQQPLRLSGMSFLNARQGWTAGDAAGSGAVWQTADGGQTWRGSTLPVQHAGAIGFAGESRGWMTARTGCHEEKGQIVCAEWQLLRTDDGGLHFQTQTKGAPQKPAGQPADDRVFAVSADKAFVIADTNLLATADGGANWRTVDFGIGPFLPEEGAFLADGQHGWVMGRAGKGCRTDVREATDRCATTVVATADGGAHWKMVWSPQDSTGLRTVGISFLDAKRGWMLILSIESLQATLYGTTDGGATWSAVSEMRGGRPYVRGLQFVDAANGFIPLSAGAGPISGGLAKTTDGGKTFQRFVNEEQGWSFEQLQFFSAREGWVRVSDPAGDYLQTTIDGGTSWRKSVLPAARTS
ncbi:WD40/YVTN/BNR-like repeat-containing protein [Paenibacillus cymbidii]|uniref:WD40/YVTN/BNR-like repeat-containing protein n=1 Tax=Paenibacillus cymbidii TaxID=1639034 RepID=UPI001081957A|nr:hypothetical protein [Paenibacillus cymbidii]